MFEVFLSLAFILIVLLMVYFVFFYKEKQENFQISPNEICFLNKFVRLYCNNCMFKHIKNASCNLCKQENQFRTSCSSNNYKCEYFINKKTGLNK